MILGSSAMFFIILPGTSVPFYLVWIVKNTLAMILTVLKLTHIILVPVWEVERSFPMVLIFF